MPREIVVRMYDKRGIKLVQYATRFWVQVPRVGDRIMLRDPDKADYALSHSSIDEKKQPISGAGGEEYYEAEILKVIWGLGVHGVDENAVTLDCKWGF